VKRLRWQRVVGLLVLAGLIVLGVAIAWLASPQPTLPEAQAALRSDGAVAVSDAGGRLTFAPLEAPSTGLVIYPGGRVPGLAYAPLARAIAERGYLVVIAPMPLNLAVLDAGVAGAIMADHPQIGRWAIGGHSLGGAMAAQYAADHADTIDGLVLWGAYSAVDLSATDLEVLVAYGSLDTGSEGFTSPDSLARLPADATVIEIVGGNHANFGWYTGQPNDPPAAISREEQQRQAVEATVELLRQIADRD
jgi:hypothetical protein